MDPDLENLVKTFDGYGIEKWQKSSMEALALKIQELRDAIRKHRDERGHDRCWLDDQALYQSLPEASPGDLNLPPKAEFIRNCHAYWEHRQDPSRVFLRQVDADRAVDIAIKAGILNPDGTLSDDYKSTEDNE